MTAREGVYEVEDGARALSEQPEACYRGDNQVDS